MNSSQARSLGFNVPGFNDELAGLVGCQTPGPTGRNDFAEPFFGSKGFKEGPCCWLGKMGNTPGPLGVKDHGDPTASPAPPPVSGAQQEQPRPAAAASGPPHKLLVKGVVVAGGPLNNATIDLVNEAAKAETNKRFIAYEAVVKVGGSLAWRANNPGNLRWASTQIGSAPGAVGNFAVFATLDDGRAAQKALYLSKYGNMTVRDAITGKGDPKDKAHYTPGLTPPSENDTETYLKQLKAAGVDLDKDVKSQIDQLMKAIKANEGMIEGTEVTRVKEGG
jgi:hypothetical protein